MNMLRYVSVDREIRPMKDSFTEEKISMSARIVAGISGDYSVRNVPSERLDEIVKLLTPPDSPCTVTVEPCHLRPKYYHSIHFKGLVGAQHA